MTRLVRIFALSLTGMMLLADAVLAGSSNTIIIGDVAPAPIPEPGTMLVLLGGLGAAGAGAWWFRRGK